MTINTGSNHGFGFASPKSVLTIAVTKNNTGIALATIWRGNENSQNGTVDMLGYLLYTLLLKPKTP